MKNILYGDGETEPNPELASQLASEAISSDLLVLLVHHIQGFEFEVFLVVNGRQRRMLLRYSII
jgi:Mo25-like